MVTRLWAQFERARVAIIHEPSLLITVLSLVGVFSGLSIAALLSHDPREAGAYAVACVTIGSAMAAGVHARLLSPATSERESLAIGTSLPDGTAALVSVMQQEIEAVAHDLRAPSISISSYLDLVASGALGAVSDEAAQALRRAAQLSERAQAVVASAIHAGAAGGNGDTAPAMRAVPLARTISEVATALTPALRERDASLTVEGTLPAVIGDEAALFRIFENLVQNAIKYCPDGRAPRVAIRARRLDGTTIEVMVTDNGCGLPGDPATLTLRGVRGANATGVPGHGLGLATVTRLVSRMQGTVSFVRNPDGGTSVHLTLPAA
ncbi:MAG: HAMP domain-containing sensor histidine kinase [Chloroflexi bacterium]|nr:HAMP domain-containing sensor histidine kinase [Chloroflexota bacterium]